MVSIVSIKEIQDILENKKAIKNPTFITKIIETVTKAHERVWKEELDRLAFYIKFDEYVNVMVSSRYRTYYFTTGIKDPEYINELEVSNIILQRMYDIYRFQAIQAEVRFQAVQTQTNVK